MTLTKPMTEEEAEALKNKPPEFDLAVRWAELSYKDRASEIRKKDKIRAEELEAIRSKPPKFDMVVRWVELDYEEEQEGNIPAAITDSWGTKSYYKLQQYFDGKWNDVEIPR